MKRQPEQRSLFPYTAIAEAKAPPTRHELPPDYGSETDWTPVAIPDWLALPGEAGWVELDRFMRPVTPPSTARTPGAPDQAN